MHTLLILSSAIVSSFGSFIHEPLTINQAKQLVQSNSRFTSAVGHEATAALLSDLLGVTVPASRIQIEQQPGQAALVFRPSIRVAEGAVLSAKELVAVKMSLSLLIRTA